jgi:cellulose synthase/poly-beta-1,6-N-acetylglucosamine synthase-like glycosyltransferase
MRASVVISVRHSSPLLGWVLHSATEQTVPDDQYEVIVVDCATQGGRNGPSADTTRQDVWRVVSMQAARSGVAIRYLYEPSCSEADVWLSAVQSARGRVVVELSPDEIVDQDWLEGVLATI